MLVACGAPSSPAGATLLGALPDMKTTVASATGYPASSLDILASASRLQLSVSDAKLASLDVSGRVSAAGDLVAAMEKAMGSRPEFSGIQEISIAVVHPSEGSATEDTHTEDVLAFRKGANQRFIYHIS